MSIVRLPFGTPESSDGSEDMESGVLLDDVSELVVGIYGWNNTDDNFYREVELLGGRTLRLDLPPHTPDTERGFQIAHRLSLIEVTKTRAGRRILPVPIVKKVLPFYRYACEREYANPRRASPVVLSVTETTFTTGTTKAINLPATVDPNDGLWIDSAGADNGGQSAPFTDMIPANPTGFTTPGSNGTWVDDDGSLVYAAGRHCIKVADGSEDGTTVNMNTVKSCAGGYYVKRIQAGTWAEDVAALECSAKFFQNSINPDPPSLTPSWGSADTLWGTFLVVENDIGGTPTSPSGYTAMSASLFEDINSTIDAGFAFTYRTNTTATENPGTWTLPAAEDCCMVTSGINPTGGGGAGGPGMAGLIFFWMTAPAPIPGPPRRRRQPIIVWF